MRSSVSCANKNQECREQVTHFANPGVFPVGAGGPLQSALCEITGQQRRPGQGRNLQGVCTAHGVGSKGRRGSGEAAVGGEPAAGRARSPSGRECRSGMGPDGTGAPHRRAQPARAARPANERAERARDPAPLTASANGGAACP